MLNLVAKRLEETENVVVSFFNPWLFKGRDELVAGFFNALRSSMGKSRGEAARGLVEALDRYWGAVRFGAQSAALAADLVVAGGAATGVWTKLPKLLSDKFYKAVPRTPDEERKALEEKIARAGRAVVVLIDELDRVEDDEVRAVAQLIKAIGEVRGVSYLVAYDPERVVRALGRGSGPENREAGERYLEKIIQHPIPLRPLFQQEVKAFLNSSISDYGIKLESPRNNNQDTLFSHIVSEIETPREIKRLVGAFSVVERAVSGEVCPYDVLGYCWIMTKSPTVREGIADNIDELVDDPGEKAMLARFARKMNKFERRSFIKILGDAAIPHEETLKLLFPGAAGDSEDYDGDRVSKRRNLLRLLYLGNPPGMIRRRDLERLWNESGVDELESKLRQHLERGSLEDVLDRLDDLLPSLPGTGDLTFWVALARALRRDSDWLTRYEVARQLALSAARTLARMARRDPSRRSRVQNAVGALVDADDLLILPRLLRDQLYAHGMTSGSSGPRGGEVMTKQETADLLSRELPRYRKAVLDGVLLRRLANSDIIFVMIDAEAWDTELRSSLTIQLNSLEALRSYAGLLVPPGYLVSVETLNVISELETLRDVIETTGSVDARPGDEWVDECLRRLTAIVAGRGSIDG